MGWRSMNQGGGAPGASWLFWSIQELSVGRFWLWLPTEFQNLIVLLFCSGTRKGVIPSGRDEPKVDREVGLRGGSAAAVSSQISGSDGRNASQTRQAQTGLLTGLSQYIMNPPRHFGLSCRQMGTMGRLLPIRADKPFDLVTLCVPSFWLVFLAPSRSGAASVCLSSASQRSILGSMESPLLSVLWQESQSPLQDPLQLKQPCSMLSPPKRRA